MSIALAVTMGDPAGVGPELGLRLLAEPPPEADAVPLLFGDAEVLDRCAAATGLPSPDLVIPLADWKAHPALPEGPAVIDFGTPGIGSVTPGKVDATTGAAAYRYIVEAIDGAMAGHVGGVVTNPIHKEALRAAGVAFPGHTELLARRTRSARSCMMLTTPPVTCSFVTGHVGYREVPGLLASDRIVEVIDLTANAMARLHGRPAKIAVCGLNPHAGEHGLFGDREEERIILPAIEVARSRGFSVEGPMPPDTAFVPAVRGRVDAHVCMYHDQGLIPLKALAFDRAVNVTLGLPIIRTSVGHGTALDIAWKAVADPSSLFRAFAMAAELSRPWQPRGRSPTGR
jgi:4-hydroxythreonine-4-phosphate dehydrogenase